MFIASGVCVGVKSKTITPKDPKKEAFDQYFMGLAVAKQGGYEGETEVIDFRMTRDDLEANLDQEYMKLKGKRVHVPFFITSSAVNGRAYVNYVLNGQVIEASERKQ